MLHIHSHRRIQEDAESRLRVGNSGGQYHFIFLPISGIYSDFCCRMGLDFSHRSPVNEFYTQSGCLSGFRNTGPDTETILSTFGKSDTEETIVFDSSMFLRMTGITESEIVRITLERSIIFQFYATTHTPALKPVARELE